MPRPPSINPSRRRFLELTAGCAAASALLPTLSHAAELRTDREPTQERTLAPACGWPGLRACRDDQLHAACLLQDATWLRCTSS